MKVNVVGKTLPMVPGVVMPEHFIAYCARVSNPGNKHSKEYANLIQYLMSHKHWSPFEMANVVIEIETTRDVSREILRHRSMSFQEFSQRYSEAADPVFRECRLQDTKNRQSSLPCEDEDLTTWWHEAQTIVSHVTQELYKDALNKGVAKEVARAILPEGLTPTNIIVNGTIRSWIHFLELRDSDAAQKEIRLVAQEVGKALVHEIPVVFRKYLGS